MGCRRGAQCGNARAHHVAETCLLAVVWVAVKELSYHCMETVLLTICPYDGSIPHVP